MAEKTGVRGKGSHGAAGKGVPCGGANGYDRMCATCARACKQQVTCVVVSCPLRVADPAA